MEIDTHSPTMNYSLKRARSPGSPSHERQPKRPTFTLEDAYLNLRASSNHSLNDHHQLGPDDWVRQASGLSIESPLSVSPLLSPSGDGGQDENMALDLDEPVKSCLAVLLPPVLQQPSRAHTPAPQLIIPKTHRSPPRHTSQQHTTFASPPLIVAEPTNARASTPHLHIVHQQLDILPDESLGPPQIHNLFQTTSSGTIISCPSPTRQCPGTISSCGRKQRFTMGPRADCLKCRMGVKGHWMHFD